MSKRIELYPQKSTEKESLVNFKEFIYYTFCIRVYSILTTIVKSRNKVIYVN
jgi:hypothetical protein